MFEAISTILTEVFSGSTDFYIQVIDHVRAFHDGVETRQQERLEFWFELEILEPMTLGKEIFNQHTTKALKNL